MPKVLSFAHWFDLNSSLLQFVKFFVLRGKYNWLDNIKYMNETHLFLNCISMDTMLRITFYDKCVSIMWLPIFSDHVDFFDKYQSLDKTNKIDIEFHLEYTCNIKCPKPWLLNLCRMECKSLEDIIEQLVHIVSSILPQRTSKFDYKWIQNERINLKLGKNDGRRLIFVCSDVQFV